MEDKLDIIIALLRKLVDANVTTNQNTIDPAVYIIVGDMQLPIKVLKDMNPDLILKHTTQRGVQTRVWKEKS